MRVEVYSEILCILQVIKRKLCGYDDLQQTMYMYMCDFKQNVIKKVFSDMIFIQVK